MLRGAFVEYLHLVKEAGEVSQEGLVVYDTQICVALLAQQNPCLLRSNFNSSIESHTLWAFCLLHTPHTAWVPIPVRS